MYIIRVQSQLRTIRSEMNVNKVFLFMVTLFSLSVNGEKIDFKSIFHTPRRNYDDLEILERSSFEPDDPESPAKTLTYKKEEPKAIANAQVLLTFPIEENKSHERKLPDIESRSFVSSPMIYPCYPKCVHPIVYPPYAYNIYPAHSCCYPRDYFYNIPQAHNPCNPYHHILVTPKTHEKPICISTTNPTTTTTTSKPNTKRTERPLCITSPPITTAKKLCETTESVFISTPTTTPKTTTPIQCPTHVITTTTKPFTIQPIKPRKLCQVYSDILTIVEKMTQYLLEESSFCDICFTDEEKIKIAEALDVLIEYLNGNCHKIDIRCTKSVKRRAVDTDVALILEDLLSVLPITLLRVENGKLVMQDELHCLLRIVEDAREMYECDKGLCNVYNQIKNIFTPCLLTRDCQSNNNISIENIKCGLLSDSLNLALYLAHENNIGKEESEIIDLWTDYFYKTPFTDCNKTNVEEHQDDKKQIKELLIKFRKLFLLKYILRLKEQCSDVQGIETVLKICNDKVTVLPPTTTEPAFKRSKEYEDLLCELKRSNITPEELLVVLNDYLRNRTSTKPISICPTLTTTPSCRPATLILEEPINLTSDPVKIVPQSCHLLTGSVELAPTKPIMTLPIDPINCSVGVKPIKPIDPITTKPAEPICKIPSKPSCPIDSKVVDCIDPIPTIDPKPVYSVNPKPIIIDPKPNVHSKPVCSIDVKPITEPQIDYHTSPIPIVDPQPVHPIDCKPIIDPEPVYPINCKPIIDPEPVDPINCKPIIDPEPVYPINPKPDIRPKPVYPNNSKADCPVDPKPLIDPEPVHPIDYKPIIDPESVHPIGCKPIIDPEPVHPIDCKPIIDPEPVHSIDYKPIIDPEPVHPIGCKPIIDPEPVHPIGCKPIIDPEPVDPINCKPKIDPQLVHPIDRKPIIDPEPVHPIDCKPIIDPEPIYLSNPNLTINPKPLYPIDHKPIIDTECVYYPIHDELKPLIKPVALKPDDPIGLIPVKIPIESEGIRFLYPTCISPGINIPQYPKQIVLLPNNIQKKEETCLLPETPLAVVYPNFPDSGYKILTPSETSECIDCCLGNNKFPVDIDNLNPQQLNVSEGGPPVASTGNIAILCNCGRPLQNERCPYCTPYARELNF